MTNTNHLPPELLSHTFSILFGLIEQDLPERSERKSYELLDILLVSRHWNHIACATPTVWTTVYVTKESGASRRVERYLERSGALALDVVMVSTPLNGAVQNAEEALQMLREHTIRWRSFSTTFTTPTLSNILEATLPNLLSFSYCHSPGLSPSIPPTVILDAPKLQTLIAHADTVHFKNKMWPTLKHLDIRVLLGLETWVWNILGASEASLESLALCSDRMILNSFGGHLEGANGFPVSFLPSLKSFNVCARIDYDLNCLRFAAMPSLTHLTLELDRFQTFKFLPLTLPPFDLLQNLRICTISCPNAAEYIDLFLKLAPNLTSFTLAERYMHGDLGNGERMIGPLLSVSVGSSGEPLVGRKLEEVHLLRISPPIQKLKELVDLRAGCLKKVVLTRGWEAIEGCPTAGADRSDLLSSLWKNRVMLEEVDERWR